MNRSGDGVRDVIVARSGERGPCGAAGGGINCAANDERCVADALSGVPIVLFPGIRGKGCVMEGTKDGGWNDWGGELVRDGDGLRDELPPGPRCTGSNLPVPSWY